MCAAVNIRNKEYNIRQYSICSESNSLWWRHAELTSQGKFPEKNFYSRKKPLNKRETDANKKKLNLYWFSADDKSSENVKKLRIRNGWEIVGFSFPHDRRCFCESNYVNIFGVDMFVINFPRCDSYKFRVVLHSCLIFRFSDPCKNFCVNVFLIIEKILKINVGSTRTVLFIVFWKHIPFTTENIGTFPTTFILFIVHDALKSSRNIY